METKEKVLFVDDEPNLLANFRRLLRRQFDVHTADSGRQALEMIVNNGPFTVIVSDLSMPGMDGIQLLARAGEIAPDTVRILLTGQASIDVAIEAVNTGSVFRFLTKPCQQDVLSQSIAAGIGQYRLIIDQRELHALKKVKEAMEGIILGFSTIVETRDPYTAGHQKRVTELSLAIAKELGFDQDRLTGLRMAGLVHDIGKIYVPAEFLNKPGKLSEIEFNLIKYHPVVGHDILKTVDFAWPLSKIVHQHHERIDGSGYPAGLTGEGILLEARIIAVADVVDAMASHRPYRPSLGIEKALDEIMTKSGTLYDPEVVEICLRLFREKGFQWTPYD